MLFISTSDAGGVGCGDGALDRHGQESDATQGASIVVSSYQPLQSGRTPRVSLLSWRSTKLKRKVPATLAGEALGLSAAIFEVEWMQCMYQDVVFAKLLSPDWRRSMLPFGVMLRSSCTLGARQNQAHVIDAKSVFDVLQKAATGSRQDRRTALELAIIAEALRSAGAPAPRWVPHARMPADALTKEYCTLVNSALDHLIRTCTFGLRVRRVGESSRGRVHKVSHAVGL